MCGGGGIFNSGKNEQSSAYVTGSETWLDHAATSFAKGSGTADDPYQISTAEELALLSLNNYKASVTDCFVQTANIQLGRYQWYPIGTSGKGFCGDYDGQNYRIEGVYINNSSSYAGLFGYAGGSASSKNIQNIVLRGGSISAGQYVGSIVGNSASANITNCKSNVSVKGTGYVGGICGSISSNRIRNCGYSGSVISTGSYVGGIAGRCSYGSPTDCVAQCDVTGTSYVAGITGYTYMATVDRCIFEGTITGSGSYVAGLMGYGDTYGRANNSIGFGYINYTGSSTAVSIGNTNAQSYLASGIGGCAFIGTSNKTLPLYSGSNVGHCYSLCNGEKKYVAPSSSSNWSFYWAIVAGLNDGMPVPKTLFAIADGAQTTEEQLTEFFRTWTAV